MLKRKLFGYDKKLVDEMIEGYEFYIDTQRRDIENLKRDRDELKNSLFEISQELQINVNDKKK